MDEPSLITQKLLMDILGRVLVGKPEGYSVIFTEYSNPNKCPSEYLGPVGKAFKDVLNGTYSNSIGKDVIFETPAEVMSLLRMNIGRVLSKIEIEDYYLPITIGDPVEYFSPVIITKNKAKKYLDDAIGLIV